MCKVQTVVTGPEYSVIEVIEGKQTNRILAVHGSFMKVESELKGANKVKLGSPINESTMRSSYPEVMEQINNRKTTRFRFISNMGQLQHRN